MSTLQDSGARREFESGAVRDISEGKGRCDLLPLDVVTMIFKRSKIMQGCDPLEQIEKFKEIRHPQFLADAIIGFCADEQSTGVGMMLEVSKHFEDGAKKYGENNWKKGIPLHCYIDSAVRHYLKYLNGDTDEPHDRAFVWNLMCAIWTKTHKPELDDIEKDISNKPHYCGCDQPFRFPEPYPNPLFRPGCE